MRLIGTYKYVNAGKCWIAKVLLEDTDVIVKYQPSFQEVKQYNNKRVIIKGKINMGDPGPKGTQITQRILAPHLVGIKSIAVHKE